ncbi:hypothetical protein EYF80_016871 [Liparis tanakae]|uniref:Uncharacterized protein n=1 Tax=Liparis tanakae TaxID=230148 RepID=A0A4Z2I6M6_9TELE|nr:hypothetical protein EYF80_016871 [Liparis tanakae]
MLARSCSQLEAIGTSLSPQQSSSPEFHVCPSTLSRPEATPFSSAPPISSPSAASEQSGGQGDMSPLLGQPLYLRRRAGRSEKDGESVSRDREGLVRLVRSHSEPGIGSSTDTVDFGTGGSRVSIDTALPMKSSMKTAAIGGEVPSKPPTSPLRLPKDCHRSLGDLKVTRGLVARFLQRSKRNLSHSSEHAGSTGQGPKKRSGVEGAATNHLPFEQVLLTPWSNSRGYSNHHTHHPHGRGHHHSHSDSRHNRHHSSLAPEGIHLRSCGDLSSSSSASLRRLVTPHGSSGALYSESAL